MHRQCCKVGAAAIVLGVMIILAMLLPTSFWFYLIGTLLICVGVALLRH